MDGAGAEWARRGWRSLTMSCAVLVLLIWAGLPLPASADNTGIVSRLPQRILMNTSILVVNPPVRMDLLSVRWEHDGRPLVEYKDGNMTFYSPGALMPLEQIEQGNISLVLTNLTLSDAGNYTCVVQYGGTLQTAIYSLIIEASRIRLLNITPPPQKDAVTLARSTKRRSHSNVDGTAYLVARLGENMTLPCTFKTDGAIEMSMLDVHWLKDGVTVYYSNKTCCDFPGFDISEEDLQNGKAPLQLVEVQEKDAGVYTCSISYKGNQWSWNTTIHIQGDLPPSSIQTLPPLTPRRAVSEVPESATQYRTLKYGLVSGVVVLSGVLVALVYFCFQG